ncbi:MAG: gamma carbonic anhydrase family protein [Deltaproteobacteria bacterium]|nr:MAG: gamma carbonic anhydrase family protein [Deltaproteobacteria bacterium]
MARADVLDPKHTVIDPEAFVAKGAVVIGDVHVGALASVWFGVVVRGDMAPIRIGARTNVQDNSVLHVDAGFPCTLHEGVTIGHGCIVHGCTVGAGSLVGMGSILMNGVVIGEDCLVAAGSLLPEGKTYAARSLIMGRPGRVVRTLTDADIGQLRRGTEHYVAAGQAYVAAGLDVRTR